MGIALSIATIAVLAAANGLAREAERNGGPR